MKCRRCREPAVIDVRRHNAAFCRDCFLHHCREQVRKAIDHFDMLAPGERVLVAISGGKDSHTLLDLLRKLQRRSPVRFELIGVTLDQGHPGFPGQTLVEHFAQQAVPFHLLREDTYSIVLEKTPPGKTMCTDETFLAYLRQVFHHAA